MKDVAAPNYLHDRVVDQQIFAGGMNTNEEKRGDQDPDDTAFKKRARAERGAQALREFGRHGSYLSSARIAGL